MRQFDKLFMKAGSMTGTLIKSIVILLISFYSLSCQNIRDDHDVTGNWISTVDWFQFVIRVSDREDGSFEVYFDLPGDEAWDIPVDIYASDSSGLLFDIFNIRCKYQGVFNEGGDTILGKFIGPDGDSMAINLVRTDSPPVRISKRPQEPEKPYPYKSENVRFMNRTDDIELQGTLTIPDTQKPCRAVILVSGSGPNDRDQLIWGHRTFLVLSDYLTRHGIAVLRYDDRGVGRSEGNYDEASFADFSSDALAACEYLMTRSEIDPGRIGLLGHSEGGAVAPMAASVSEDISFVVLLAAPGNNSISGEKSSLISQFENNYRNRGASEEAINFKCRLLYRIFIIAREEEENLAREKIRELLTENEATLLSLSEEDRKIIEMESAESYDIEWVLSTRFLNVLKYDPQATLSEVSCPVLALHGTKDRQIPVDDLQWIEQALIKGGNKDYTTERIEGLNHLFQTAESGDPSEYSKIEETIAPEALKLISDWILHFEKKSV